MTPGALFFWQTQRLENWGARRAAFRPYFLRPVQKNTVFSMITRFLISNAPRYAPRKLLFWIVGKCLVDLRDQILRLVIGQVCVDVQRDFGVLMASQHLHRLDVDAGQK